MKQTTCVAVLAMVLGVAGVVSAAETDKGSDVSANLKKVEGKVESVSPNRLTLEHDPGIMQSAKKMDFVINDQTKILEPNEAMTVSSALSKGDKVSVTFKEDPRSGEQIALSILAEDAAADQERQARANPANANLNAADANKAKPAQPATKID